MSSSVQTEIFLFEKHILFQHIYLQWQLTYLISPNNAVIAFLISGCFDWSPTLTPTHPKLKQVTVVVVIVVAAVFTPHLLDIIYFKQHRFTSSNVTRLECRLLTLLLYLFCGVAHVCIHCNFISIYLIYIKCFELQFICSNMHIHQRKVYKCVCVYVRMYVCATISVEEWRTNTHIYFQLARWWAIRAVMWSVAGVDLLTTNSNNALHLPGWRGWVIPLLALNYKCIHS